MKFSVYLMARDGTLFLGYFHNCHGKAISGRIRSFWYIEEEFSVEISIYGGCFQLGLWRLQVFNGSTVDWLVLEESQVIL